MEFEEAVDAIVKIAEGSKKFKIGRTSQSIEEREQQYKTENVQWRLHLICSSPNLELIKDWEKKLIKYFKNLADDDLKKKCENVIEEEIGSEKTDSKKHLIYVAAIP